MVSHKAVFVSDHAYWRAAERFPGFDTVVIEDEVKEAFLEGRVTTTVPAGFREQYRVRSLYAVTPGGDRCYVLAAADNGFVVITVLSKVPQTAKGPG